MKLNLPFKILWLLYTLVLVKLIFWDQWGMAHAGIGELPIDGIRVGILTFLPYCGISMAVWWEGEIGKGRIWALILLSGTMVCIGLVSGWYLEALAFQSDLRIEVLSTHMYFTVSSALYMVLNGVV